jgi:hypothetical protein
MKNCVYWAVLLAAAFGGLSARSQENEEYEQSPVNYSHTEPRDAVARLKARIASGELKFAGDDREVFKALLREMGVPVESQILVFSKTSFQRSRISPDHPRALYYSDNCYLGWAPGGLAEVATIDPELGPVFYSFDPRGFSSGAKAEFKRDADCMGCHGGSYVRGIPGVFARSVYPDENGEPLLRQGTQIVDFRTPFEERWGGWYVTGTHGKALHRGNAFASEKGDQLVFNPASGANRTNLASFFDGKEYLSAGSDIVSLMVFEYQTAAQDALTRAGLACRRMLDYQERLEHDLREPVNAEPHYDSVKSVFESSARDVVDALLFKDEAAIPEGVKGSAAFQRVFAANAPRASDGSSLKELLIAEHLFKNRCGYLIYSDLFLALPRQLKQRIYAKLALALRADNPDPRYGYIGAEERGRIVRVLRQTHPDLKSNGWLAESAVSSEPAVARLR